MQASKAFLVEAGASSSAAMHALYSASSVAQPT
jgi:hypothetical protein